MRVRTAFAAGLVAGSLSAATIPVNSLQDSIADDGKCTLREAIIAANSNAPSGAMPGECPSGNSGTTDVILLPTGTLVLALTGSESEFATNPAVGDLDILQSVDIRGQGPSATTISALGLGARVLHIDSPGAVVTLTDLGVTDGASTGNGGGIFLENGLSLTLVRTTLSGNTAVEGGGIWANSAADLSITASTISGNIANDGGGGGVNWSGCLGCTHILTISNSIVTGNQSQGFFPGGGGVFASGATMTLLNSTVAANHSDQPGGGLWIADGSFTAPGSTVSGNDSNNDGGGIYFDYPTASTVANCTISVNTAVVSGGAVASTSNDQITFRNCTIAGNTAGAGTAVADSSNFIFVNSIVAGTCAGGPATSMGGNIESPGDNCGFHQVSDHFTVSAGQLALGALRSNGGPTLTHLPGPSSLALNAALLASCPSHDQRGVARPKGSGCEIGSVEVDPNAIFADGFEFAIPVAWSAAR